MRRGLLALIFVACKSTGASPLEGRELFSTTCARCHGSTGAGGVPLWDSGPAPRNLRDPTLQASLTDDQIKGVVLRGKAPGMPAFESVLTATQVEQIVLHVRTLGRERNP